MTIQTKNTVRKMESAVEYMKKGYPLQIQTAEFHTPLTTMLSEEQIGVIGGMVCEMIQTNIRKLEET